MPVIFEKQIDTAKKLAVWQITESDEELFKISPHQPRPEYSIKRNRELAVSALLLNYLSGYDAHMHLTKDVFGKPYIENSGVAVSFSHSHVMVACILDVNGQPVGIDIEKTRESIRTISQKFCNETDTSLYDDILHYHLIWGGKEVLFKIYSKKELDFREHLKVNLNEGDGKGEIMKGTYHSSHLLQYEMLNDYVLVWGF